MIIVKTNKKNTSTKNNATNNNVHVLGLWEETGICSKKKKKHVEHVNSTQLHPTPPPPKL